MVSEDSEDIYSNIVSSLALVMAVCINYVYSLAPSPYAQLTIT